MPPSTKLDGTKSVAQYRAPDAQSVRRYTSFEARSAQIRGDETQPLKPVRKGTAIEKKR